MRIATLVWLICAAMPCASQTDPSAQEEKPPRFHLYAGLGLASSRATSNFIAILNGEGFEVRRTSDFFYSFHSIGQGSGIFLQGDYSVNERTRLGLAIATVGRPAGSAAYAGGERYASTQGWTSVAAVMRASTIGYYAQGSYAVLKHRGSKGADLHAGFGIGVNDIHLEYGSQTGYIYYDEFREMQAKFTADRTVLGALVFANFEFWSSRWLSICLNIAYRYLPVQSFGAVDIDAGNYVDYSSTPPVTRNVATRFPAIEISFSSVLYGFMVGMHF
jgi:hypothetical protein